MSAHGCGAFTGELSAEQLSDFGVHWVIVGHSERRNVFGEADDVLGTKLKNALEKELNVIFCVGEKLPERESGSTNDVISK